MGRDFEGSRENRNGKFKYNYHILKNYHVFGTMLFSLYILFSSVLTILKYKALPRFHSTETFIER